MYIIKFCLLYLIILMLLLIVSCTDTQPGTDLFKGKDNKIFSTPLVADSVYLRYPFRIKKMGANLFISDLHGSEFYCYRFSYPQLQLKERFAVRGQGPNEFLVVESMRFNNNGDLVVLDANKSMITAFDTTKMEKRQQI